MTHDAIVLFSGGHKTTFGLFMILAAVYLAVFIWKKAKRLKRMLVSAAWLTSTGTGMGILKPVTEMLQKHGLNTEKSVIICYVIAITCLLWVVRDILRWIEHKYFTLDWE